jgi:hypothetical protein
MKKIRSNIGGISTCKRWFGLDIMGNDVPPERSCRDKLFGK